MQKRKFCSESKLSLGQCSFELNDAWGQANGIPTLESYLRYRWQLYCGCNIPATCAKLSSNGCVGVLPTLYWMATLLDHLGKRQSCQEINHQHTPLT